MALPSKDDLAKLDIAYQGAPFCFVEAKSLTSTSLDIAYQGAPFVAVGPSAAPAGLNVFVNVAGVWKQASAMYVKASGVWKTVSTISTRVSGAWKS